MTPHHPPARRQLPRPEDDAEQAFEEAVTKLIPGYLLKRRQDLETLRDALRRDALETIQDLGHRLAGSGGAYGFPELSRIGSSLEAAAQHGERETIALLLAELEARLAEALEALEAT